MKNMIYQDSNRSSSCKGYIVLKSDVHVTYVQDSKVQYSNVFSSKCRS